MNKTLECYPGIPCTGCKQKNRLTEVLNLATGDTLSYSLPPERAVVSAYMTQTKKNHIRRVQETFKTFRGRGQRMRKAKLRGRCGRCGKKDVAVDHLGEVCTDCFVASIRRERVKKLEILIRQLDNRRSWCEVAGDEAGGVKVQAAIADLFRAVESIRNLQG